MSEGSNRWGQLGLLVRSTVAQLGVLREAVRSGTEQLGAMGKAVRTGTEQLGLLREVVRTGSERGRRGLDLTLLRRDRGRALRDLGESVLRLIESGELLPLGDLSEPYARVRDAEARIAAAQGGAAYGDAVHEAFLAGELPTRPSLSPLDDGAIDAASSPSAKSPAKKRRKKRRAKAAAAAGKPPARRRRKRAARTSEPGAQDS